MTDRTCFLTKLADILFPRRLKCQSCGREAVINEHGLCPVCEAGLVLLDEDSTPSKIEFVDAARSALLYNEVAKRAVIDLKFHGATYKKEFLSCFMQLPNGVTADCIVPVPLHPNRLKKRGYNQSALLAKELSKKTGLPMREDLLYRVKNTTAQSSSTKAERLKNVVNAFRAEKACKGLSIVLVDDVRTTGSTLKECAKQLKKQGAAAVYAVTACCAAEYSNASAGSASAENEPE